MKIASISNIHLCMRVYTLLVLVMSVTPVYAQVTGLEGAVSSWLFEEGWGSTAVNGVDEIFNGNIIDNPGWVSGMYGQALSFDGDIDAVEVPANPLMGAHALTIQAYIKPISIPDAESSKIFNIALERDAEGVDRFMLDILPSDGGDEWVLSHFMSIAEIVTDPEDDLLALNISHPFDQWYHVAMVFDSVSANSVTIRHYVNHLLEYETQYSLDTLTQGEVFIGERYAPKGEEQTWNNFNGTMDNLVLHDRALTTDEFMPAPGKVDFDAEPLAGPAPLEVSFLNGSPSNISSWFWNFGDDQTSSLKDPAHTYGLPGSYSVVLIGMGLSGADTLEKADFITVTEGSVAVDGKYEEIPSSFELTQNYPNPFNPETMISFQLPQSSIVSLRIYDITGRLVRTLADGYWRAGYHGSIWDTRDNLGNEVAGGIYFYSLVAGEFRATRRMVLLR